MALKEGAKRESNRASERGEKVRDQRYFTLLPKKSEPINDASCMFEELVCE